MTITRVTCQLSRALGPTRLDRCLQRDGLSLAADNLSIAVSLQSGVIAWAADQPLSKTFREFGRVRAGENHRTRMTMSGCSRHKWIDDSALDELPFAVKHFDADAGKNVECDLISGHQICNWPIDPKLQCQVVLIQLGLADHVHIIEIRGQPLSFDRESNVRVGILGPVRTIANAQCLDDVIDHLVGLPFSCRLPGLPGDHFYTRPRDLLAIPPVGGHSQHLGSASWRSRYEIESWST